MRWKHDKKESDKELLERSRVRMLDQCTLIKTCCECKIYIHIQQLYNYTYSTEVFADKVCESHKTQATNKYMDKIRSKLE